MRGFIDVRPTRGYLDDHTALGTGPRVTVFERREQEMADDASGALGAPEIAGSLVNPKGFTKKVTAATAGSQLGGAIGSVAAGATPVVPLRPQPRCRASEESDTSQSAHLDRHAELTDRLAGVDDVQADELIDRIGPHG